MRLFCRVTVLGLLVFLCRPAGVDASPITVLGTPSDVVEAACSFMGATEACRSFTFAQSIDPGTLSISGTFQFDNDIALFAFNVSSDVLFTATTFSYGDPIGGFDPILALYDATLTQVVVNTSGGPVFAVNDDISPETLEFNARLSNILLTAGSSYFLALTQTLNNPHEQLADPATGGFDMAAAGFACYNPPLPPDAACTAGAVGQFGGFSGNFALDVQLAPVDTAVPEPGTLALLGTGLVTAIARRRAKRAKKILQGN